jgi:SAM-dependent methyltransferase
MLNPVCSRRRMRLLVGGRVSLVAIAAIVTLAMVIPVAGEQPAAEPRADLVGKMKEGILAHLALKPGMTVAEIGAGGGWFVFRAAELIGPKGKVYATDIDPKVVTSLRQQLQNINPMAATVDVRLCHDERDTALDDLPDDHVDVVLMVDSLCFDALGSRQDNVEYLRRFLRILRPGGRFVHHMDCRCEVSLEAIDMLLREAGFTPREPLDVAPDPKRIDPSWLCQSQVQRKRQAWLGVFEKPERVSEAEADGGGTVRWSVRSRAPSSGRSAA